MLQKLCPVLPEIILGDENELVEKVLGGPCAELFILEGNLLFEVSLSVDDEERGKLGMIEDGCVVLADIQTDKAREFRGKRDVAIEVEGMGEGQIAVLDKRLVSS